MSYTLSYAFNAPAGSSLEAVVRDTDGTAVGSAVTAGFVEVSAGFFGWVGTIPDGQRGFLEIRGAGGGGTFALFAVNPQEGENLDTKVSDPVDLNLDQTVPFADISAKTTQTVGDALSVARADGAGKWVLSGTTLTLYGPDGSTIVRQFTLDDATTPTTRS